jgi:hypothetical protein
LARRRNGLMNIGIIAEEDNDVDVIKEIIAKIISPRLFSHKKFVGHGCGKVRRKCSAWAKNLKEKGCELLIVVHDLDRESEASLRVTLEKQIENILFKGKQVLIPKEELEAWLLADDEALKQCFNLKKSPKTPHAPENIPSPKEHLQNLIWKASRKRYVNTIHNKKIAHSIDIKKLSICPSYLPLPEFLIKYAKAARKQ